MKRFIDKELKAWKENPRRKPLIVRGARQVGKTYSIKQFGAGEFENYTYIDLERNIDMRRLFEGDLQAKKILADIEVLLGQRIIPGKTLLVIDEIQACPRAITALRYFFEEIPLLHVIAAGSLLEFALGDISFPVGRVQFLYCYPLTFAEYLAATGHGDAALTILKRPFKVSDSVHAFLCEELRRYFFVGGMPESVNAFVETGSMKASFEVQAEICETFRMDFSKYSRRSDKDCLNSVLTATAKAVGQQTKYSRLAEGCSNPTIKKAYDTLGLAGVLRKVASTDPSGLPLGANASSKIFKTILLDLGLMRYLTGMPTDVEYSTPDLLSIYRGGVAEQFAGQELSVSQNGNLFYWARHAKSSSAEVDFCVVADNAIIPVEVKSGPSGKLKSMHLFLKTYPNAARGYVFSTQPYALLPEEKIAFIPLYFAYSATGGFGEL
ncbi:MAG: AAA family ATPase [Chitinivibrionales bacterium]|nr:AAA family ATPase [Chitinivibrionales bacterium]